MSEIPKLNQEIMEACQLYVDNLIKPIHSLGKLEDMAVRMAGILGEVKPTYLNKAVVIFGGDTAVDGENKTKGQLSHAEMKLVAQGAGPVNVLARQMEMPVYLVDVGLEKDTSDIEGILAKKVIHGTHQGHPAMDDDVVAAAISLGMSVGKALGRGHPGLRPRQYRRALHAVGTRGDDSRHEGGSQEGIGKKRLLYPTF